MKIKKIILWIIVGLTLFSVGYLAFEVYSLKQVPCGCENKNIENDFDDTMLKGSLAALTRAFNDFVGETRDLTSSLNSSLRELEWRLHSHPSENYEEQIEDDWGFIVDTTTAGVLK